MHYLCIYNGGEYIPLSGPMRSQDVVDIIVSVGSIEEQAPYCNASRYELTKSGQYPSNKAGDQKLAEDIEKNKEIVKALVSHIESKKQ